MPEIVANREFFTKLNQVISSISNHARSLIEDVDSNVVEQFNSIIVKFTGGKRINFSRRRSYAGRCNAAVVSFNSRRCHYELHKQMYGISPGKVLKRYEQLRRHRQIIMRKIKDINKNRKILKKFATVCRRAHCSTKRDNCAGGKWILVGGTQETANSVILPFSVHKKSNYIVCTFGKETSLSWTLECSTSKSWEKI